MVLDAQALNACVGLKLNPSIVMTPHVGEASRWLDCSPSEIEQDRLAAIKKLVTLSGAVVVLKGAGTWVGSPSGQYFLCPWGNSGMATAGMGDVLSGIIGALLARGIDSFQAACIGVAIRSQAGDLAAQHYGRHSLIASDAIQYIAAILHPVSSQS